MRRLTKKVTPTRERTHNSRLVLKTIYESGQISRADIARTTGLTRPTVSAVVAELIERQTDIRLDEYPDAESLCAAVQSREIEIEDAPKLGRGTLIDQLYKKVCRPQLEGPIFLTRHPIDLSPLARRNDADPTVSDRFQLVVRGWEVMNAYSELVDPLDQRRRLEEQARLRIEITDGGYVPAIYAPFQMMSQFSQESTSGHHKGVTVAGHPGFEKWEKKRNATDLTLLVSDRYLVHLDASVRQCACVPTRAHLKGHGVLDHADFHGRLRPIAIMMFAHDLDRRPPIDAPWRRSDRGSAPRTRDRPYPGAAPSKRGRPGRRFGPPPTNRAHSGPA